MALTLEYDFDPANPADFDGNIVVKRWETYALAETYVRSTGTSTHIVTVRELPSLTDPKEAIPNAPERLLEIKKLLEDHRTWCGAATAMITQNPSTGMWYLRVFTEDAVKRDMVNAKLDMRTFDMESGFMAVQVPEPSAKLVALKDAIAKKLKRDVCLKQNHEKRHCVFVYVEGDDLCGDIDAVKCIDGARVGAIITNGFLVYLVTDDEDDVDRAPNEVVELPRMLRFW